MNLPYPVTIQPPPMRLRNGQSRPQPPLTLHSLDVTIMDNAGRRMCLAQVRPLPRSVVLWEGAAYDAAGDYTQAQVEARVLEVLGPDIKAGLEALFLRPTEAALTPPSE